jgi:cephalosporin hydroxylase
VAEIETPVHLRLATAALLRSYFEKHGDSLAFHRRMRNLSEHSPEFKAEYVLYHSWLPGFVELAAHDAEAVRHWMKERVTRSALPPKLATELAAREWCAADAAVRIDQLLEKAFTVFSAMQNPTEFRAFLEEIAARHPRTVVEIGTASGGTLYCMSQLAAPDALLVSIDFPGGPYGGGQDDEECRLFSTFVAPGQRLEFIRDRSFHHSTRLDLAKLLAGREVDVLLIDGDHSYAGVKSDFEMYREFVRAGGLIALHDIAMFPDTWGRGFDVGILWREIVAKYQTREIIDRAAPLMPPPVNEVEHWGIPALGFGLVLP